MHFLGPSKPAYKENMLPTATVKPVPPVVEVFSRPAPVPKPPSPSFGQSGYTVKKKPQATPAIAKPTGKSSQICCIFEIEICDLVKSRRDSTVGNVVEWARAPR